MNSPFQFHIMISGAVQLVLLVPTILLIWGAARRVRWLIVPWLIVYGVGQLVLLLSILSCVIYLPENFKVFY